MFPIWGWLSALGCVFTIASGPLVAAQPWPWALYLGDVAITGLGAYFFLFDWTVGHYASALKNGSATNEPDAAPNGGPAEPLSDSGLLEGPPSVS